MPDNTLVYRLNLVPRSLTPAWVRSKNHREVRMGWHVARETERERERKTPNSEILRGKKNDRACTDTHTMQGKVTTLCVFVCRTHLCAHWPEERWQSSGKIQDSQFNMQESQQLFFQKKKKKKWLCVLVRYAKDNVDRMSRSQSFSSAFLPWYKLEKDFTTFAAKGVGKPMRARLRFFSSTPPDTDHLFQICLDQHTVFFICLFFFLGCLGISKGQK